MFDKRSLQHFVDRAEQIFLQPQRLYSWNAIITGAPIARQSGAPKTIAAVETNTFRGFHKIDKSTPGSAEAFRNHLTTRRDDLVAALLKIEERRDLHELQNRLRVELRGRLFNIKQDMLAPYNKIRKPLDLYIEHLVAMASELAPRRHVLVPYLYLPLDSQILGQHELFSDRELRTHGLNRNSSYSQIRSEAAYLALQEIVKEKARLWGAACGRTFHPIYFDLLWNGRYQNWGSNLFETNP